MTSSRVRAVLLRASLLLAPAVALGCEEAPPAEDALAADPRYLDEGRVELGDSSLEFRNFDARPLHNARHQIGNRIAAPRRTGRFAAPDILATFDEATGATRTVMAMTSFLTEPAMGEPRSIALAFALAHTDLLGLREADLAGMEITDHVFSRVAGTTHIYYRQRHLGLPVYNGQLQLNLDGAGRIVSINNAFAPNIAAVARSAQPAIGAEQAVARAAANLSIDLMTAPSVLSSSSLGAERATMVSAPGLAPAPVEAALVWVPIHARHVALAWRFQIETLDGAHHFDYTVDAHTGKVWTRIDWVSAQSYRAYKEPAESPNHTTPLPPADGRVVITNPASSVASPLGWHNDGTASYTVLRGNNVHAYDDRDANNQPPMLQPDCGPSLNCDFPINLASNPSTYTPAAITNLFYWSNLLHDVAYQYGFDEASGNFQFSNLGKGGLGNDALRAEGQDASGSNTSTFATPPDGNPPRMQMFEWTTSTPRRDASVSSCPIAHEYAHGISNRLVGGPSNVSCLGNAQNGGEGWSDWYSLWFSAKPGDVGATGRGVGTYCVNQPTNGPGIRTMRYSTDPAINTYTYASIAGKEIPHGVGEVWAQALWEVYWALVNRWGFDANLHDALGRAGNQRAMLYVTQGFKNTACSPTFVNARDGIIAAAAALHGGEDVCLLWRAFAAFGLGTNAVSGGQNSTTPTNGFQVPATCIE